MIFEYIEERNLLLMGDRPTPFRKVPIWTPERPMYSGTVHCENGFLLMVSWGEGSWAEVDWKDPDYPRIDRVELAAFHFDSPVPIQFAGNTEHAAMEPGMLAYCDARLAFWLYDTLSFFKSDDRPTEILVPSDSEFDLLYGSSSEG